MTETIKVKIAFGIILSINLLGSFFLALLFRFAIFFLPLHIAAIFLILNIISKQENVKLAKKKYVIWGWLSLNLLYSFLIGATIPLMDSNVRYNFGLVMIPMLIALNYVLLDRFYYHIRHVNQREVNKIENQ